MKPIVKWLLLAAAMVQFAVVALPPGDADLISIQSLALDLSRGDSSQLYPGSGFSRNDAWVAHHSENLKLLGSGAEPNWCFYPPLVPFVLSPFASMGADSWRLMWGGFQIVLMLGLAALIHQLLIVSRLASKPDPVLILALVFGSYPVAQSVALGQTSLLLTVILWSGFLITLLKLRYASMAVGVAIFVKPFLLPVTIPDFLRNRMKPALAPIGIAAGLFALSLFFVGLPAHIEYLRFLRTLSDSQTAYAGNQSLLAGMLRAFTDLRVMDYGFAQEPLFALIAKLTGVAVLAAAGYAQWRSPRNLPAIFSSGLWISAALLALSISWEHHIVFLLPVVAALWTRPLSTLDRRLLIAAILLFGIYWKPLYGDEGVGRVFASFPLYGNLIFFWLLFKLHGPRGAILTADPEPRSSECPV
jgi:hypothetical protein